MAPRAATPTMHLGHGIFQIRGAFPHQTRFSVWARIRVSQRVQPPKLQLTLPFLNLRCATPLKCLPWEILGWLGFPIFPAHTQVLQALFGQAWMRRLSGSNFLGLEAGQLIYLAMEKIIIKSAVMGMSME